MNNMDKSINDIVNTWRTTSLPAPEAMVQIAQIVETCPIECEHGKYEDKCKSEILKLHSNEFCTLELVGFDFKTPFQTISIRGESGWFVRLETKYLEVVLSKEQKIHEVVTRWQRMDGPKAPDAMGEIRAILEGK